MQKIKWDLSNERKMHVDRRGSDNFNRKGSKMERVIPRYHTYANSVNNFDVTVCFMPICSFPLCL